MKFLFLVPARGSSKGLPGKNLMALGGVPLVGRAARTAERVARSYPGSRVVCSTDDPAIADAAREWGAEVPFMRPPNLATDEALSIDVVIHALDQMGEVFDGVVLLQPTSPLVEPGDVRGALEVFERTGAPVISVCRAEHPIEWYQRIDETGRLIPVLPAPPAGQRQNARESFRPNGAVYVASIPQLRRGGFWVPDTRAFIMPVERSVDIDTSMDFVIALALVDSQAPAP